MVLVQVEWFRTGTRYDFEILHQCVKRVETKSHKNLGGKSYVCRSYREKIYKERGLPPPLPPSWIGLSIHWYIAENFLTIFCMSVLFRHCSKSVMFSRFLKVAMSDLMKEVYNGGFSPDFSVSMLKEIIPQVWDYMYRKFGNKTRN